jgi:hypothetical protein
LAEGAEGGMIPELQISLDRQNLAKFRRLLVANPRIAAQSLTFTAEKARDAWRVENHRDFHMRRDWIDKGVRVQFATPSNLMARVGTIDKYMGRHIVGAGEEKKASGSGLFVPIKPIEQQGTHTQIRAQIRAMGRTKSAPFWRHGMLLRRLGRGHDAPLTVVGVMRQSVHIKPRMDAVAVVDVAVQAAFPSVYERLLLKWAEAQR